MLNNCVVGKRAFNAFIIFKLLALNPVPTLTRAWFIT